MSTSGAGVASSSRPHGSGSISSTPDPRSKAIDLSPLKELVKDSLLETLIGIPGGKTLVLDKDLSGSLGLVVDVGSLKVGSNLLFDQEDGMLSRLHLQLAHRFDYTCFRIKQSRRCSGSSLDPCRHRPGISSISLDPAAEISRSSLVTSRRIRGTTLKPLHMCTMSYLRLGLLRWRPVSWKIWELEEIST